ARRAGPLRVPYATLFRSPARIDLAWGSIESNAFGLHEFGEWARDADVEPVMALNLGTRGVLEAVELLDYANGSHPTALARERAEDRKSTRLNSSHVKTSY